MKILITGAAGHLGAALVRRLSGRHEVLAVDRAELDICDATAVGQWIAGAAPDAVVNCAAFTDVDRAEDEPLEALAVNAVAVRTLAGAARRAGAVLVHYSTDFVFDGCAATPYRETDEANPRSTYACSKLLGEWFAADAGRYYVLRVESLFGSIDSRLRPTSIDRMVEAVAGGQDVRVFTDRVATPSYTADVSMATEALLVGNGPSGLYHCVNSGACSFADVATEIGRQLGRPARLTLATMKDAALRAERPKYCALSNEKLAAAGIAMPSWQDALARYLRQRAGVA